MEQYTPLDKYLEDHCEEEDQILYQLNRDTFIHQTHPRMLSGKVQGKFLEFISKMVQPKNIIEIGTFTGYSAICLSKGMQKNGQLDTFEINDELEDIILKYFNQVNANINLHIGDAIQIIPKLNIKYDLAFIDGDKKEYQNYYDLILEKINPGGYILIDNVLWSGKVYAQNENPDNDTQAIINFNKFIQQDSRVENVMIPLRDGIMMVRKK